MPKEKELNELLIENGILLITSGACAKSPTDIIFALMTYELKDPTKEIKLYISSTCDEPTNMLAIYDTLKAIKNPISATCVGLISNYGALLLSAANKGRRFALKHSQFSLREPYGYLGSGANQQTEVAILAKETSTLRRDFEELFSKETGQPVEKIHEDLHNGLSLNAEEAKAYGIIDEVI